MSIASAALVGLISKKEETYMENVAIPSVEDFSCDDSDSAARRAAEARRVQFVQASLTQIRKFCSDINEKLPNSSSVGGGSLEPYVTCVDTPGGASIAFGNIGFDARSWETSKIRELIERIGDGVVATNLAMNATVRGYSSLEERNITAGVTVTAVTLEDLSAETLSVSSASPLILALPSAEVAPVNAATAGLIVKFGHEPSISKDIVARCDWARVPVECQADHQALSELRASWAASLLHRRGEGQIVVKNVIGYGASHSTRRLPANLAFDRRIRIELSPSDPPKSAVK